jgi:NAD(P)H-dependent FMN reductase
MRVLGLSGSLRAGSHNARLLRAAGDLLPARGELTVFDGLWAQAEARKVLSAIGARVIDRELPVGLADDAFTSTGTLADPDLSLTLADLLAELAAELVTAWGGLTPLAGEVELAGQAREALGVAGEQLD